MKPPFTAITCGLLCGLLMFSYLSFTPSVHAATISNSGRGHAANLPNSGQGHIEFRIGSSTSAVVAGARVIVINHDGQIVSSGLTDTHGTFNASVPLFKIDWNKQFTTKGIVNAIVIANGFNEQAVFIIPITEHTIQPVVLQPINPERQNLPSASLGAFGKHDLRMYVAHYAYELKLKKQPPIPRDPDYAPWSSDVK